MRKLPEFWIRSLAVLALAICCLLLAGPLYVVATSPDNVTPEAYYVTLFDAPADALALTAEPGEPLIRMTTFLAAVCVIAVSGFRDFRFRAVPVLILGLMTTAFAFMSLYPAMSEFSYSAVESTVHLVAALGFVLIAQAAGSLWPGKNLRTHDEVVNAEV